LQLGEIDFAIHSTGLFQVLRPFS